MWEYKAKTVRVLDGDSIEVSIDLGFNIWFKEIVRLAGIDAPETRGPTKNAGLAAKSFLEALLPAGTLVTLQTQKATVSEKYGRYLARVILDGLDLSDHMIIMQHAKPYDGGQRTA